MAVRDTDGCGDLKTFLQSRPLSGPKATQRNCKLPPEVGWQWAMNQGPKLGRKGVEN